MLQFTKPNFHPQANPNAIVVKNNARFTILTPSLIRMEYDPEREFEDRPSQIAWNRDLPVPQFSNSAENKKFIIETEALKLEYRIDKPFDTYTLSILCKRTNALWKYGDFDFSNLKGTCRTLDNTNGIVDLEDGLNSLSGWSLVDDTHSLVFTQEGWLTPRNKPISYKDLYFFGYGRNYLQCIQDFQKISGNTPLLPRWALGNWWSRYWKYSDTELLSLMDDFSIHNIPLSVCIIDMDWHITKTNNGSSGWTGYTWNKDLFPNPQVTIEELHNRGLRTALNLHPAEGIHSHEEAYVEFAERMNVDPKSSEPIKFDIANPDFAFAYFELLHRPYEDMGIDFWWIDWQQGESSSLEGLDPLYWLNHLHSYEQMRKNDRRAFIFSRWPGLGGHRYPIGFSGDTYVSWEALDFQPYFTATAANVAFGWWSHDIGGHMNGIEEPELYLRWLQFGVFSPILRLHSTKNPYHERRPWGYDLDTEVKAREAMQLRHRLVPYIYNASHVNEVNGTPLLLPMYFNHPHNPEAYECNGQYYFGSELMAAPFTQPKDPYTNLTRQVVWFPEGDWFNFFSGEHIAGGGWKVIYGDLGDIPVFAKAGAIIPLSDNEQENILSNPDRLSLKIFAGADNQYELYEDDGFSQAYKEGSYSTTKIEQIFKKGKIRINIHPISGEIDHLPIKRYYELSIIGINAPKKVTLIIAGKKQDISFAHDIMSSKLEIDPFTCGYESLTELIIEFDEEIVSRKAKKAENLSRIISYAKLNTNVKFAFMNRLENILINPKEIVDVMHNFHESILLAIGEIILGTQNQRISYNIKEEIQKLYKLFFQS